MINYNGSTKVAKAIGKFFGLIHKTVDEPLQNFGKTFD
jgi:hypothetical protein